MKSDSSPGAVRTILSGINVVFDVRVKLMHYSGFYRYRAVAWADFGSDCIVYRYLMSDDLQVIVRSYMMVTNDLLYCIN